MDMEVICIYKTPITRDNRKKNCYSYMVVVLRAILILSFFYVSFLLQTIKWKYLKCNSKCFSDNVAQNLVYLVVSQVCKYMVLIKLQQHIIQIKWCNKNCVRREFVCRIAVNSIRCSANANYL